MVSVKKSITGCCWHVIVSGQTIETRGTKWEADKVAKHYERLCKNYGL